MTVASILDVMCVRNGTRLRAQRHAARLLRAATANDHTIGRSRLKMTAESWPNEDASRVMVIAAHPDDPEFGCGATIAKWAR